MMGILWACFCAVFALMSAQRNGYDWARRDEGSKILTALMTAAATGGAVYFLWPYIQI